MKKKNSFYPDRSQVAANVKTAHKYRNKENSARKADSNEWYSKQERHLKMAYFIRTERAFGKLLHILVNRELNPEDYLFWERISRQIDVLRRFPGIVEVREYIKDAEDEHLKKRLKKRLKALKGLCKTVEKMNQDLANAGATASNVGWSDGAILMLSVLMTGIMCWRKILEKILCKAN